MKKLVLSSLTVCSIALLAGGVTADAAKVEDTNTKGFVEFIEDKDGGGGTTEPGDPGAGEEGSEEEVDPGNPGDGGGGSTDGALRLVYVPDFDFGTHKISYSAEGNNYYAAYQTVEEGKYQEDGKFVGNGTTHTRPSFFVVRDVRSGSQGWSVSLSSDEKLTNTKDANDVLDAHISFQNMFVTNTEGFKVDELEKSLLNTGSSSYSTLTKTATTLVSAPKGHGSGTYSVLLGTQQNANADGTNPSVKLHIPKGQVISNAKYETTLNWAINDTL